MGLVKTAVCVTVKNEAGSVLEWIGFHAVMGFDTLLIIDDNSTDETREIARQASHHYDVRVSKIVEAGLERQNHTYGRVCRDYAHEFDWIAFLDSDEYLVGPPGKQIADLVASSGTHTAISVPWLLFGSSRHIYRPNGLVIESYRRRSRPEFPPNRHVKTIVQPGDVQQVQASHAFRTAGGTCLPGGEPALWASAGILAHYPECCEWHVHHYFTRSRYHWSDRMARGQMGGRIRTWLEFNYYDRNEVYDSSAAQLAPAVRREMGRMMAREPATG